MIFENRTVLYCDILCCSLQGCTNLRELLLWGNNIHRIDKGTFAGLSNLRKLDLDRNQISSLSRGAFTDLSALEVVHLGENRIGQIQDNTFILAKSLKVSYLFVYTALQHSNLSVRLSVRLSHKHSLRAMALNESGVDTN